MKKCIVNYACQGRERYLSGQARLLGSIRAAMPDQDTLFFTVTLPGGCPTHTVSPYAFKYFIIQEAFNRGYDHVLWLDASIVVMKPLDPLWKVIDEKGFLVFSNGGKQADFTTETCLNLLGSDMATAANQEQISGGMVGYNLHNLKAMIVFEKMLQYAKAVVPFHGGEQKSSHPTFRAHRHDQSCLTHLVYLYEMPIEPQGWVRYDWDKRENPCERLAEIRGM